MRTLALFLLIALTLLAETPPPLLVIREISDDRGARVRAELEPAFSKAGFRIAVLSRDLADEAALDGWLKTVARDTPFDSTRIALFGFSAAGSHAATLAGRFPTRFCVLLLGAALEPLPRGVDAKTLAGRLPVGFFCGENDDPGINSAGENAKKTLDDAGGETDWNLLPGADHMGVLSKGAQPMADWAGPAAAAISLLRKAEGLVAAKKSGEARKVLAEVERVAPNTRWATRAKARAAELK